MRKNIFDNSEIWNWVDENDDNKVRFDFTEQLVPEECRSLADIGCGHGGFLRLVAERRKDKNLRLVAVDNSDGALSYINFEKHKASITKLPFADKEFDCVTALEVIEHLNSTELDNALSELARVSNKYVIISVPYNEDIEWNMARCPHCFTKFHYDGHLQRFTEDRIKTLMDKVGFKCEYQSKLGWSSHLKYHKTYVKLVYPSQRYRCPHYTVCPACNSELTPSSSANNSTVPTPAAEKRTLIKAISRLAKLWWPREQKSYWIIGLYKKA